MDDAKDFYKRKVDYLKSNIEKLTETLSQKQRSYNVLIDVMQQKVSQIEAQQQGSSGVGGSSGAVPKAVAAN